MCIESELFSLTQKYSTPLYAYDGEEIENNYKKLKECMNNEMEIFYSVKANPNITICKLLRRFGSGIDIASGGELLIAKKAGFRGSDIIYTGPGKTFDELEAAVKEDILCIMAESNREINLINEISCRMNKITNIGIRINPNFKPPKAGIQMGGEKQFGIDEPQAKEAVELINRLENVKLVGVQVYSGTQVLDATELLNYFTGVLNLIKNLRNQCDINLKVIDTGGGMGVNYVNVTQELNLEEVKVGMKGIIAEYKDMFPECRIVLESGRYLMATSGYYLSKVLYKKEIKNKKFLVTNGGMNQSCNATFRGKLFRSNFPISILNSKSENIDSETVSIVGPLCTSDDLLGTDVTLPVAQEGDIVCIHRTGAYGLSFSPILFLGHPTPAEVLVYKGQEYLVRSRGTLEDLIINQDTDIELEYTGV